MSDFKIISADEAKKLIETKNVTIVDIRDPQAYEEHPPIIAFNTLFSNSIFVLHSENTEKLTRKIESTL